jgi:hypothetical protein
MDEVRGVKAMRRIPLPLAGLLAASALSASLAALFACAPVAQAKSEEWLRRDREVIRQQNLRELARVRERDAQYAAQSRASGGSTADYARRRSDHDREMRHYQEQQRRYRERLAEWREDVAQCRAGNYSACD